MSKIASTRYAVRTQHIPVKSCVPQFFSTYQVVKHSQQSPPPHDIDVKLTTMTSLAAEFETQWLVLRYGYSTK